MTDLDYRSEYLVKVFRTFVDPNASILEIGSGDGRNLRWLKEAGFKNVGGVDKLDGTAIEDIPPEMYDVIFTMSTLFLIPKENEWVFEKIASMVRKYLVTIEGETTKGEVLGRNYQEVFGPFGLKQIHMESHVFNEFGVLRIFSKA